MSKCKVFDNYQKKAEDISTQINENQNIKEKARLANKLLDLEKEITTCQINDDPKCRLQRKVVIPARRKVAEMVIGLSKARR